MLQIILFRISKKRGFMKKIFCILLLACLLLPVFAVEQEEESLSGISVGARISLLGIEPSLVLKSNHLESEISVPMWFDPASKALLASPGVTLSYNTRPFGKGYASIFGAEFLMLSPYYAQLITRDVLEEVGVTVACSLFYKGQFSFRNGFGINMRIRAPLVGFYKDDNDIDCLSITVPKGFLASCLIELFTISLGVKFDI